MRSSRVQFWVQQYLLLLELHVGVEHAVLELLLESELVQLDLVLEEPAVQARQYGGAVLLQRYYQDTRRPYCEHRTTALRVGA